ncbi:prepilin-type N-terminal cleavage/methylation domain-containing protein [Helicobacter pullorum]|uniref:prepilin-type N-terminal cleavage/methylation domain-containing protein n=1 Tax=Helicobacter pullorum TaxID=35818 RepID=UPI0010660269|nr:prepilin-type N-terminal cleavage/methylation domain-containing protein [Helicobacter pullorum]
MYFKRNAFSLLEIILALILLGILLSFALPKVFNYQQSACDKKLQLQVFNFKTALRTQIKTQNTQNPSIDLQKLYDTLDMHPSTCYFETQKNGFIGINQDKKVYFIIKNGILECEHTKSATLHNGESYCDIF